MSSPLKRRDFIALLAGAAAGSAMSSLSAHAQPATMPVVGFLRRTAAGGSVQYVSAFRQALQEAGFAEGQTVAIEYRWAEGHTARLPALAADLVHRRVAVIVAGGSEALAAAKAATSSLPIVFATGDDPVRLGVVASLNRPGGNITGVSFTNTDLSTKRLELLRDLLPKVTTIAVFKNPSSPGADQQVRELEMAARSVGKQLLVLSTTSESDFEPAFATLVQKRAGALIAGSSALFTNNRRIVTLAAQHAIPAIYDIRENVVAGGLMSYGASVTDAYRQAGVYVGRILKGAKPADLPVAQPTKFEMVINLKTAKVLGLMIPQSVLIRADEVIQ